MTVRELRDVMTGVPDDAVIVFQGNDWDDWDDSEGPVDYPSHTSVYGPVFSVFYRKPGTDNNSELVFDGENLHKE